ncbi:sensor histidine kinase [Thalassolituus sp. LLYu03]|uniref:sensor histidine kinase n=1 Tax=Thalassolituus sp. LLYu03 TaxID=3421656 RepID=UPI003D2C92B1
MTDSGRFAVLRARLQSLLYWRQHLLISAGFILLLLVLVFSLDRYWRHSLQPRLYLTAQTQASILAQSQATVLLETLEHSPVEHRAKQIYDALQEILIVTDPAVGKRMVQGVMLEVDYDLVDSPPGSLNLSEGNFDCATCFHNSVPLINGRGDLLGVAAFTIGDDYYQTLSADMQSRLFRESSLALVLVVVVWLTMLSMFHRLAEAKRIIEASDKAKTRFMANVTHELRTPLNAILGYTQIYKTDSKLMAEYGRGIETIDRSADHLLLMINDILDFSRADEANLAIYPREVNLPDFLRTLVEMTDVRARLKELTFQCEFPPTLPVHVRTDDKRLRQVLLNLLSNAVKFTERGSVSFKLTTLQQKSTSVVLRFSVRDTGIGMAKHELGQIFIPFQQLDNAITRAEGSGLGLTISQRLVHLMDSELHVRSEAGVGSEFWFDLTLPVTGPEQISTACAQRHEVSLVLPPQDVLNQLMAQAGQHNILAVRETLQTLEADGRYRDFLEQVRPYVQHYRFKPLVSWLQERLTGGEDSA